MSDLANDIETYDFVQVGRTRWFADAILDRHGELERATFPRVVYVEDPPEGEPYWSVATDGVAGMEVQNTRHAQEAFDKAFLASVPAIVMKYFESPAYIVTDYHPSSGRSSYPPRRYLTRNLLRMIGSVGVTFVTLVGVNDPEGAETDFSMRELED